MEKLRLEISTKMINICQEISQAKIDVNLEFGNFEKLEELEQELGKLVFNAMEDCPF